ncbi:MAG: hypothetical protein P8Y61_14310, partial [Gammaproteobacteria bacterium]
MMLRVPCATCHRTGHAATRELRFERCIDCHRDPHQGTFQETCETCHTVNGFQGTAFDHLSRTKFPLEERHAEIECVACHNTKASPDSEALPALDYRGLNADCVTCHKDVHSGALGATCASCHGTRTFRIATFEHAQHRDFFRGKHRTVECATCHRDAVQPANAESMVSSRRYRGLSLACADCHQDVH